MHKVKCAICGESFDRDKIPYVQSGARRYAHATCSHDPAAEVIDPTDEVVCCFCNKSFSKKETDYISFKRGKFAHRACAEKGISKEKSDIEILYDYILTLFGGTVISPKIRSQIKTYVEEYHYTYSGIYKTLKYFYEVKHGDLSKSNNGIGIVGWTYNEAMKYYYSIWSAEQKNQNKVIEKPKEKTIVIPSPEKRPSRRSLFSFLDEEGEE